MNFLAHLYLSGNDEKIMVGNFIGDFVKGRQFEKFEKDIERGILLHRHIDAFTDQHEQVRISKDRLRPKYNHYSGVIVDMFYDHFLAINWKHYHPLQLSDYTASVYALLKSYMAILPTGVKNMLPFMINNNWLLNYSHKDGIRQALTGMARRTPYKSKMEQATNDLSAFYNEFQAEFKAFFPDVIEYSRLWLEEN